MYVKSLCLELAPASASGSADITSVCFIVILTKIKLHGIFTIETKEESYGVRSWCKKVVMSILRKYIIVKY